MLKMTTRTIILFAVLVSLLLCAAQPAGAAGRDLFDAGSMRMSILIGNGYAFNESYSVIGLGFGYFIAKGFELGLDAETWSGASPHIEKISPSVRYVFPTGSSVRPYVGAFYRRTIIANYDDLNSAGGRAGIYFVFGRDGYIGLGGVYENYLSCNEAIYHSCSDSYPEITFAIAF